MIGRADRRGQRALDEDPVREDGAGGSAVDADGGNAQGHAVVWTRDRTWSGRAVALGNVKGRSFQSVCTQYTQMHAGVLSDTVHAHLIKDPRR